MSSLNNAVYTPPFIFRNKHFNTAYRTLFHRVQINYKRKRIITTDNDFLDLDFSIVNSDKIVILIHGLEGSSDSNYIKSLAKVLNDQNFDVVVLNLRGCSGAPNILLQSYHSGKTDDLKEVISYLETEFSYNEINIVGFSLGGNIALKYLGECGINVPYLLKATVTISVPCDLKGSSEELGRFSNKPYMMRFLRTLKKKALNKLAKFPNSPMIIENIKNARNFNDFDNAYTAPAHGFKDALDYWNKSSSKQFIPNIKVPTLLITSMDDPFLSRSCFPVAEAKANPNFILDLKKYGGHVGFNTYFGIENNMWLENRIADFIKK
jgi:predicted alpha/beta-fold hydrolase